jgi:Sulfotransferase family
MEPLKWEKVAEVPPPIFIVGAPRSGTTLTARILGRHSRVFMPGETHFFDDIYARRRDLGDLKNPDSVLRVAGQLRTLYGRYQEKPDQDRIDKLLQKREVVEELSRCRTYKELFSCFMGVQMQSAGKERWGNNVPKDIFQIKEIVSFYPDAKILICIRDVRDFLISYQHKWRIAEGDNAERLTSLYHPVLTSLLWQASVRQIERIRNIIPKENLMMIRYESLVQNSKELVRDVCRFIGEEFETDMLNIHESNSSFEAGQQGIYSSSVGRWKRQLNNEELYLAQNINKKYLEQIGYHIVDVRVNPWQVARILATLPYGIFRAIYANRDIRGPLLPYLAKRVAALVR